MFRLASRILDQWKTRPVRFPLLIRGARQVGKTWLVQGHGESYANMVEINLESHPEYIAIFKDFYGKPDQLVRAIALLSGKKIVAGETLLFIDEIQQSKEALLSLRYFKEQLPTQHVIAAGSLLEFTFSDLSYPVGRIEFLHLFPMNFEEYLLALDREDLVSAILKASPDSPLPQVVHEAVMEEVSLYSLIGGLPAVVAAYIKTRDLTSCQDLLQIHAASFREDFHKYASKTDIEPVRLLFQAIPRHFGEKFKYAKIDDGLRARDLASALTLLEKAGLVYRVCHTSANGLPLGAQIDIKKFKVFSLDIGLSQRILGLNLSQMFLERRELLANRGGMAEQFVAQELLSFTPKNQTPELFYWHREAKSSQAEVDLLIEHKAQLLPIEVKSGASGSMKSLHLFLKEKAVFSKTGLKVSQENFSRFETVTALPFYALMQLDARGR